MCKKVAQKRAKYDRKTLVEKGNGRMVSFNVIKTAKPTRPTRPNKRKTFKDGLLIIERFADATIYYDYTQDKHLSGARVRMI